MASFKKAFLAGVAGTIVMVVFSFISHHMDMPRVDYHAVMASFLPVGPLFGWIAYFAVGVGLAYLYGAFFRPILPSHSWGRGVIYAAILWAVMGMIFMPVVGQGFFAGSFMTAIAMFVGTALYGATVGYLYDTGPQT